MEKWKHHSLFEFKSNVMYWDNFYHFGKCEDTGP